MNEIVKKNVARATRNIKLSNDSKICFSEKRVDFGNRTPVMSKYTYERLVTQYLEQHDPLEMINPNFKGDF